MLRSCLAPLTAAFALLIIGAGVLAPAPALPATTPLWVELPPPPIGSRPTVFDSRRNRLLVFTDHCIWAVSSDPTPAWTQVWVGTGTGLSANHVYDRGRDRIWAFTMSSGGSFPAPGRLWSMDFGVSPLSWTEHGYAGTAPQLRSFSHAYDPVRDRVIVFGWTAGCIGCETNGVYILNLSGPPVWETPTVTGAPPTQRVESSAVYDPFRDRMLFFGGLIFGPTAHDETWALSLGAGLSWTFLTPTAPVPGPRWGAIAALDSVGQRMVVMDGQGSAGNYADAWTLDLSLATPADEAAWTRRAAGASEPRPAGRSGAIGWVDPVHRRLLRYGGYTGGARVDLWALSLGVTPAWTPVVADSLRPEPRFGHVAFADGVTPRWFAGLGSLDAVWSRPLDDVMPWHQAAAGGPGVRYWAGAVRDAVGNRALVFGGGSSSNTLAPGTEYSDLWAFGFAGSNWTQLSPTGAPPARADALCLFDAARRRMIVYGGRYSAPGKVRPRTDTWSYDVATNAWTQLAVGSFGGRWSVAGIVDSPRDRMVAFGGADTLATHADVHVLPLAPGGTWTALATTGTPPPVTYPQSVRAAYDAINDRMIVLASDATGCRVFALTLDASPVWSELTPNGGMPRPRQDFAFAVDPANGRLVVSQGQKPGNLGSTYDEDWVLYFDETMPALVYAVSVDAAPDRVLVAWQLSPGAASATVQKRPAGEAWGSLYTTSPDGSDRVTLDDEEVVPGGNYDYRLAVPGPDGERLLGEVTVAVPRTGMLALVGALPNPSTGAIRARFSLTGGIPARLELLDVGGRLVAVREVGGLGPGTHTLALVPEDQRLPAGIYLLRLTEGRVSRATRVAVLR